MVTAIRPNSGLKRQSMSQWVMVAPPTISLLYSLNKTLKYTYILYIRNFLTFIHRVCHNNCNSEWRAVVQCNKVHLFCLSSALFFYSTTFVFTPPNLLNSFSERKLYIGKMMCSWNLMQSCRLNYPIGHKIAITSPSSPTHRVMFWHMSTFTCKTLNLFYYQ